MSISVLYDGWSLIYRPTSPEALHLLAILEQLPAGVRAIVAMPDEPPEWLPEKIIPAVVPAKDSPGGRLRWEQRNLNQLGGQMHAELIHTTSPNPPLFGYRKTIVSPAGYVDGERKGGFSWRLRDALSQGGMARASSLVWPEDLPSPQGKIPIIRAPAIVYNGLVSKKNTNEIAAQFELPESYILYHGPCHRETLLRAISAWSWAADAIGEYHPLLFIVPEDEEEPVLELVGEYGLEGSVRTICPSSPLVVPAIFAQCTALFHPAPISPWGGAVRRAMVNGVPVVAMETPMADAMLGEGAFLIGGDDTRAMGAALITVLVEEEVAKSISQAALERARIWDRGAFEGILMDVYRAALSS